MNGPYDYEQDQVFKAEPASDTIRRYAMSIAYEMGVTNGEYARYYTERKLADAKSHNDAASGTRQASH